METKAAELAILPLTEGTDFIKVEDQNEKWFWSWRGALATYAMERAADAPALQSMMRGNLNLPSQVDKASASVLRMQSFQFSCISAESSSLSRISTCTLYDAKTSLDGQITHSWTNIL